MQSGPLPWQRAVEKWYGPLSWQRAVDRGGQRWKYMWEHQSSIRIWAGTRLHPDLGAQRLGQDLPGAARILMLDCLFIHHHLRSREQFFFCTTVLFMWSCSRWCDDGTFRCWISSYLKVCAECTLSHTDEEEGKDVVRSRLLLLLGRQFFALGKLLRLKGEERTHGRATDDPRSPGTLSLRLISKCQSLWRRHGPCENLSKGCGSVESYHAIGAKEVFAHSCRTPRWPRQWNALPELLVREENSRSGLFANFADGNNFYSCIHIVCMPESGADT